jgi:hypothetical protein
MSDHLAFDNIAFIGSALPGGDWGDDGHSLVGNPAPSGDDHIQLTAPPKPNNRNGFWKYNEDKTLRKIEEYISSTYHSHYTSESSKTQTLDLIESIGDAEPFSRSNAIKYLSRFGKKGGKSKLDLLKAIHYCILLYNFSGLHNEPKDKYETLR